MNDLLLKCIEKRNLLKQDSDWREKLLPHATNVAWFGDLTDEKAKIMFVCLTPSEKEFNDKNGIELTADKKRLFHLPTDKEEHDCLPYIIDAQNKYFNNNPYARFFGTKKPSWLEAFSQGMNASLYDTNNKDYRAIVIDLVPFVISDNYSNMEQLIHRDLIKTGFIKLYLEELIEKINPQVIVLMDTTVTSVFEDLSLSKRLFGDSNSYTFTPLSAHNSTITNCSDYVIKEKERIIPVVSLSRIPSSTARGYRSEDCFAMGKMVKDIIE